MHKGCHNYSSMNKKLVIKEFVIEFGDTSKTSTQITLYDMDNLLYTVLNIFRFNLY